MKINIIILCFFIYLGLMGCGQNSSSKQSNKNVDSHGIALIIDTTFENGLVLKGRNSAAPILDKYIYPFGKGKSQPSWQLAEWFSKYLLTPGDSTKRGDTIIYKNKGKKLSFVKEKNSTLVKMEVFGDEEYDHPRKLGEAWPHLIIDYDFNEKPILKDIDKIMLSIDGRLMYAHRKIPLNKFDSSLHSAQFQFFLTIQDINKDSPGYMDFVWLGVPFYDYRYPYIPHYTTKDIGKEDATGKYIFDLGTKEYMKGSFHDKKWKEIKLNLKPFAVEAVDEAKEKGYLSHSRKEDLAIVGITIGWEVTGILNVGFEFKKIDLKYTKIKK